MIPKAAAVEGESTPTALRWTARLLSLALVAVVLLLALGEDFDPRRLSAAETAMAAGLTLACAGLLAGWRRPRAGGAATLAGLALFVGAGVVARGRPPGSWLPAAKAAAAALFLFDRGRAG